MGDENTHTQDTRCRVHLEMFEGPLDLLLYLIKRDEIEIFDIPINHIVQEFIAYIDRMDELDLSIAGEYLFMASLLMSIKARMLLPKPQADTGEIEDPRQELVDMLIQYRMFKELTRDLERRHLEQMRLFPKGSFPDLAMAKDHTTQEPFISMDMFTLVKIAWEMLKQENKIIPGFDGESVNVEERMEFIEAFIAEKKSARFVELFPGLTTPLLFVATFVAMLELMRLKKIKVQQQAAFGNIWIYTFEEGGIE